MLRRSRIAARSGGFSVPPIGETPSNNIGTGTSFKIAKLERGREGAEKAKYAYFRY